MSRHVILYRGIDFEIEELSSASQHFFCTNRRPDLKKDDLVIGRYSLLPFYPEQAADIEYVGAKLINTYNQHLYVADLQNYVADLQELTPRTWSSLQDIPDEGPFVLKGETNSRKSNWKQDMFAEDKKAAIQVYNRLTNDTLIGNQRIYIRKFLPLVTYMAGVNGMPVTKEFRFFVAFGKILCGGYYWQNYIEDLTIKPSAYEVPEDFLHEVVRRVGDQCNFYTIDVGQLQSGEWTVIELNDGQMAGLSCNHPPELYSELRKALLAKGL